jgi:asparagine synthetase B (glutamine-hydrolysing)
MDYNISAVLSTACRMRGVDDRTKVERESMARVVLSGLGADEMFSGYSRYRVAFNRAGFR